MSRLDDFIGLAGFAVLVLAVLATPEAAAESLYSVDVDGDNLMLLDSVTGVAIEIGALGDDALDIELALTLDGRLWGLNTGSGIGVDLWEIDRVSGAILSSVQVFEGATAVTRAEGLGARGNQLKIAYDPSGGSDSGSRIPTS